MSDTLITEIKPVKIGKIRLKNNLFLAPMAGFTDVAFRRLCRDGGAGLTTTEMVSCKGLIYGGEKTISLLRTADNETPSCVQLFGSDPADFKKAAESEYVKKFDIIDINMGCPMPKVTRSGAGAALLGNPDTAAKIVEAALAGAGGKPVTVKVRLGFSDDKNVVSFCRTVQSAGAGMITVHGRTAEQLYSGKANRAVIGETAAALSVPVILNGDVCSIEDARDCITRYGVHGVMIGRGALSDPQIFSSPVNSGPPAVKEIIPLIKKHICYSLEYFKEGYAVKILRKVYSWYFRGVAGAKPLRAELVKAGSIDLVTALLDSAH
jgi:nifR3 family TIM-barrel protein